MPKRPPGAVVRFSFGGLVSTQHAGGLVLCLPAAVELFFPLYLDSRSLA